MVALTVGIAPVMMGLCLERRKMSQRRKND